MYEYFAMYVGRNLTELNTKLTQGYNVDRTIEVGGKTLVLLVRRIDSQLAQNSGILGSAAFSLPNTTEYGYTTRGESHGEME